MSDLMIFIDTNVLLHANEKGLNINPSLLRIINRRFLVYVHPYVESEIISLLTNKGKLGRKAHLAIQLSSEFNSYEDDQEYAGTDSAILLSAKNKNACVFTFDKDLKMRCIDERIPVISQFKKGRLQLFGHIE